MIFGAVQEGADALGIDPIGFLKGALTRRESKGFPGESRKERRERKKFDRKARRKGQKTSADLWHENVYWKTGGRLPDKYRVNKKAEKAIPLSIEVPQEAPAPLVNSSEVNKKITLKSLLQGAQKGAVQSIVQSEQGEEAKKNMFKEFATKYLGYLIGIGILLIVLSWNGLKRLFSKKPKPKRKW